MMTSRTTYKVSFSYDNDNKTGYKTFKSLKPAQQFRDYMEERNVCPKLEFVYPTVYYKS